MLWMEVKHVAAVLGEDLQTLLHLLPHFFRGSEGQYLLSVYAAAPEYNVFAVCIFQFLRIHALGGALYRVDSVKLCLNKRGKQGKDSSAAVFRVFQVVCS